MTLENAWRLLTAVSNELLIRVVDEGNLGRLRVVANVVQVLDFLRLGLEELLDSRDLRFEDFVVDGLQVAQEVYICQGMRG